MTYKSKLEKTISAYQGDVEKIFNVSLGDIPLVPYFQWSMILAKAHVDVNTEKSEYSLFDIRCNNNIFTKLLPQSIVDYIGIHEMVHLAHAKSVKPADWLKLHESNKYIAECVADYATHKILAMHGITPNEYEFIPGVVISISHLSEQAKFLQTKLEKLKTNITTYIQNINYDSENSLA